MAIGKINPHNKGALHKMMNVPASHQLTVKAMNSAKKGASTLEKKRIQFALNARKWKH